MEGEDEPENEAAGKRPEWPLVKWALISFGLNLASVLMLAARSALSEELHTFFDVAILLCLTGGIGYAIARAVLLYPSRVLDLVNINFVLSLGIFATIEGLRALEVYPQRRWNDPFNLLEYIESCMLTVAVLMSGAALGLRHCHILKINSAAQRALVLSAGLLAIPAMCGVFIFPFFIFGEAFPMGYRRSILTVLCLSAAWLASGFITLLNFVLAVKSLALHAKT